MFLELKRRVSSQKAPAFGSGIPR
jgi:Sperm-tail PG-rich repeat